MFSSGCLGRVVWRALPVAAGLLASCDNPAERAVRRLEAAGINPTGAALVTAVTRRDRETVDLLLTAGVHPGQRDASGRTPLRIAVEQRDSPMVSRLLDAGVEVEARTPDQASALGAAVAAGDAPIAGLLLDAGARTDGRMADGEKIVPWLVREGRTDWVRRMISAGADAHMKDRHGVSLLLAALAGGRRELAETLLKLGADAGAVTPAGDGAVHLALLHGWTDFIRPLTAAGADPNAPGSAGIPPLHQAVRHRNTSLCQLLLGCGADPDMRTGNHLAPLHLAVAAGSTEVCRLLLQRGAQPDPPSGDGSTPLHMAITGRSSELCRLLLQQGANPRLADRSGATPVTLAMAARDTGLFRLIMESRAAGPASAMLPEVLRARWPDGISLLVDAGVHPDTPGPNGHTPAWQACSANDPELLGWLLHSGANPSRRDHEGRLLIERAAAGGRDSLVKLLMDYGGDPGGALLAACTRRDRRTAELLLACGAPADGAPGPRLETPLVAAVRSGDDELAALLAGRCSQVNPQPPEGQTLLHLAIVKGCHRTVKVLLAGGANPNQPVLPPVSSAFIASVHPGGVMRSFLRNDRNITPLMLAADAAEPRSVQHLLACGARRNAYSRSNHYWPVNFAAVRGDVPVIRALYGRNPFHEERRLVISLSAQQATLFDTDGVERFKCKVSTGRPGFATRTGDYAITDKNRVWTSTLYHVSMPYFQRLSCADFGLHQGNVPGYPASHGCIRVPAGKAAELFGLTELGDRVQIIP